MEILLDVFIYAFIGAPSFIIMFYIVLRLFYIVLRLTVKAMNSIEKYFDKY